MGSNSCYFVQNDWSYAAGEPPPGSPARDILCHGLPRGVAVGPSWPGRIAYRWLDRDAGGRYLHGDFFHGIELAMLQRAYEILRPLLEPHGEFLPIRIGKDDGYVYNVLEMVDCVDEELSEWSLRPDGSRWAIRRTVFRRNRVGADAFIVPQRRASFFVSSAVRDLVLQHDLKGWLFERVPFSDEVPEPDKSPK